MSSSSPTSDVFYKKLAEIVEANLSNEQFGVDDVVEEINLSRSQIHRKLQEISGQSITQFIREIRLERAHEMLLDGEGTASEIAYKVGFSSPTYFNKCFSDHFGFTPGEAARGKAPVSENNLPENIPAPKKTVDSNNQLVAILFSDLVGYTELMGTDSARARELVRKSMTLQQSIVEKNKGEWLKEMGDGALAQFYSAIDAVNCAMEIQRMARADLDHKLRIGIHLGDVAFENNDVFGEGVNVASRLESYCVPGGIYVTESIEKAVAGHGIQTSFVGELNLKGVSYPVPSYAIQGTGLPEHGQEKVQKRKPSKWLPIALGVVIIGLFGWTVFQFWPFGNSNELNPLNPELSTVAVLYFDNMSGDPDQEYFSDGVTEEIISQLAKIEGLQVRSRTSVYRYKAEKGQKSLREIASELGVGSILEGSIRKSGNQVRITAQLIDGDTDEHLWAENFDFTLEDIFDVQYQVAASIAAELEIQITPKDEVQLKKRPTISSEAYDLYLEASKLWNLGLGIGAKSPQRPIAVANLRKAIQIDPNYVEAYALLSKCYTVGMHQDLRQDLIDSANFLGQTAIALDPENSEGYSAMGYHHQIVGDYEKAEGFFVKAMEIDRKKGILPLAEFYKNSNRIPKATELILEYVKTSPQEVEGWVILQSVYRSIGLHDSVMSLSNKFSDYRAEHLQPNIWYYLTLGLDEEAEKMVPGSTDYEKQYANTLKQLLANQVTYDGLENGRVYLHADMVDSANAVFQRHIERINKLPTRNDHAYYDLGRIYLIMGEKEKGLEMLRRSFDIGYHFYDWTHSPFLFREVFDDPDFQALLKEWDKKNNEIIENVLNAVRKNPY